MTYIYQAKVCSSEEQCAMCVPFYTVMTTHYIICNLQIVDIYQNIRPPKKKCLKTLRTYHSLCFPSWSCGGQECPDGVPDGSYGPNGS